MTDPVTDEMIRQAILQRFLEEMQTGAPTGGGPGSSLSPITYNVYGPQGQTPVAGGVSGAMGPTAAGGARPEDLDYFVDIVRRDLEDINPETGKPMGWEKSVHRYTKKKSPIIADDPGPPGGGIGGAISGGDMPGLGEGGVRQQLDRQSWLQGVSGDIDPAKHAGEGWFQTEEYARPQDIQNQFTRAEVGREGEYYPTPQQAAQEGPAAPEPMMPDPGSGQQLALFEEEEERRRQQAMGPHQGGGAY